ncbi:hypothetical protein E0Z10_g3515 [Xylaria hypoxylon]|uniref:Uncharacterized protein n=1 Tax=Xylaria hypoxylon TaxID=37992 RepID=A0A4Z0Z7B7_9PEZI|nr:hypothetical protein E0Z10_g3515 [Xylaria hypoxylon]
MATTSIEYLTLPTVEALRAPRTFKKPPPRYNYTLLELIRYYTGNDPDLIWGPFYRKIRAAKHDTTEWEPYNVNQIWDNIPDAAQKRPGSIGRFFNWLFNHDPPPTLTVPKSVKKIKSEKTDDTDSYPTTPKVIKSWRSEIKIDDDWSPSQIDFTKWYGRLKHPADYDDEFFRNNYRILYERVCEFTETWFGRYAYLEDSRDSKEEISAWDVPLTEQFTQYARVVAHEDRGYVEWKDILNDPVHRKWLCAGIFAQIIERKIFNQLLFGASKEFQDELERHDSHWVLQEGFSRKEGRRQIARSAIGEGLVPRNFWDAVDDLTGQTVLIFQPILTLVALQDVTRTDLPGFWQEAHSLIAMAGYLQVCTAVSPSIFHILSASPGARFQWDDEAHADPSIYAASKAFHRSHEERWRVIADISSKSGSADVSRLINSLEDSEDITEYLPFPTNEQEYRLFDHQRRRGGKVMYAVFPKLTRYTAENIGQTAIDVRPVTSQEMQEEGEGMRISILSRCMVVYYQGLVHSPADQEDGIPLEEYLQELAWDRMPGILPYWRYYWKDDGNPSAWLHWPVWPEGLDKYWLWWFITIIIGQIIQYNLGPLPSETDNGYWTTVVYKPFQWFAWEAMAYLVIRFSGITFFEGPWSFLRFHALGWVFYIATEFLLKYGTGNARLFSLICAPLLWLDQVFFNKVPRTIMGLAGILDQRYDAFTGLFSTAKQTVAA